MQTCATSRKTHGNCAKTQHSVRLQRVIYKGKEIIFNLGKAAKMWQWIVVVENSKLAHACKAHKMQKRLRFDFWSGMDFGRKWESISVKLGVNIDIQQHTEGSSRHFSDIRKAIQAHVQFIFTLKFMDAANHCHQIPSSPKSSPPPAQ